MGVAHWARWGDSENCNLGGTLAEEGGRVRSAMSLGEGEFRGPRAEKEVTVT